MIGNPVVVAGSPAVAATPRAERLDLPSWAPGSSGTRFNVFAEIGVARDPYQGDRVVAERVGGQAAGSGG